MDKASPKKLASFVLGAGFSYSLAEQKLTKDFSKDLREKFKEFKAKYNFESETDRNYLDWLIEFEQNGTWDFELVADVIRHIGSLSRYQYLQMPSHTVIDDSFNLLSTTLCKQYLTFKTITDRSCQFIKLIRYLLKLEYEIHIFDLNFDQVIEKILKDEGIKLNDFFPHTIGLPTKDFKCIGFSDVFDSELTDSVNLYKLHGAFNIVSSNDELNHWYRGPSIPIDHTKRCIQNLRYGFRKVFLNNETEVIEALQKNFIKGVTGLTYMEGYEAQHSLWTGNTFKLAMIGLGQSYPSFCYKQFSEIISDSETVFVIGYGSRDPDVNVVLTKRLWLDHFRDRASINTIAHSKNESINSKLGSNLERNPFFETYLDEIQQHL